MSKPISSPSQDTKAKCERAEEENGASTSNEDMTFDYPDVKFEYLDNTADIQIHAWGDTIEEAFEQVSRRRRAPTWVLTLKISQPEGIQSSSGMRTKHRTEYALIALESSLYPLMENMFSLARRNLAGQIGPLRSLRMTDSESVRKNCERQMHRCSFIGLIFLSRVTPLSKRTGPADRQPS